LVYADNGRGLHATGDLRAHRVERVYAGVVEALKEGMTLDEQYERLNEQNEQLAGQADLALRVLEYIREVECPDEDEEWKGSVLSETEKAVKDAALACVLGYLVRDPVACAPALPMFAKKEKERKVKA
jgi:hypothetical protein